MPRCSPPSVLRAHQPYVGRRFHIRLTIIKAMLVDIAQLQQLYRIIVFFVLGVLLLLVAWGYHKASRQGIVIMNKVRRPLFSLGPC
jgi:hypothetical protein